MSFKDQLIKYYNFSEQEWEITMEYYKPMKLAAKKYFVEKGKVSKKLAVVLKGLLRTFDYDDNGNEVTKNFHEPGTVVLSSESFNFQKPAQENIVAVDDCELLAITYDDAIKLYERVPKWPIICKDVAEYKNKELAERLKAFQTQSATERYHQFCERHALTCQKATIGQIASYLGIDIATLSRIRKKKFCQLIFFLTFVKTHTDEYPLLLYQKE
jgi:CRP-like cAMP-binding protein